MKTSRMIVLLLLGLAVSVAFVDRSGRAGDKEEEQWKNFLPADAYKELLQRELATVKAAIGADDFKKVIKGKVAALMIAGYALTAKEEAQGDRAGVKNAALRVAAILGEKDKEAEAEKLAAAIASLDGDPTAKHKGMNFRYYVPNDLELMVPYMTKDKGGDGLHPMLQFSSRLRGTQEYIENLFSYMAKRPLRDKYIDQGAQEIALVGYRTAVSAEIIQTYKPKRKTKTRDPELWHTSSILMRKSALDLVQAAEKKDGEALQKAATAVLDSCVKCHKMFQ